MERKLYKSSTNRVFFGVCGGIGEFFEVDPVVIRLLTVIFTLMGGAGLLAYIIAAIMIPERSTVGGFRSPGPENRGPEQDGPEPDQPEMSQKTAKKSRGNSSLTFGVILIGMGALVLINVILPWIQDELILAAALIGLGFYFVIRKG